MEGFKNVLSIIAESTEAETHLSKFLRKNFEEILKPKYVRRPLVIGLI